MVNKINLNAIYGGIYLYKLRCKNDLRLIDVADKIGIGVSYLSEIEKGKRIPGDEFIRKFSLFYGEDEIELFDKFGRVSLSVLEVLRRDLDLQRWVLDMGNKGKN